MSQPFPWAISLAVVALIAVAIIGFMDYRAHQHQRQDAAVLQLANLAWRDSLTTVFERQATATKAAYAMTIDSLRLEVQKVRSTASAAYVLADGITADVGELEQSVQDKFTTLDEVQSNHETQLVRDWDGIQQLSVAVDSLGRAQLQAAALSSGGLDQLRSELARKTPSKFTFGNAARDALTVLTVGILTTHIVGHPR